MTVEDVRGDVPLNWLGIVDSAAKEIRDVSIVDLPMYITFVCSVVSYLFLSSSSQFTKTTATDVTLCIIVFDRCISIISACKVELLKVTSCYRDRNVRCGLAAITMGTQAKGVDPNVAAHMDIDCFTIDCRTLS